MTSKSFTWPPLLSIAGQIAAEKRAAAQRTPEQQRRIDASLAEEREAKRYLRERFPDDNLPED